MSYMKYFIQEPSAKIQWCGKNAVKKGERQWFNCGEEHCRVDILGFCIVTMCENDVKYRAAKMRLHLKILRTRELPKFGPYTMWCIGSV